MIDFFIPSELYEGTTAASGLERQLCGAIAKPYISTSPVVYMRVKATDITHSNKLPIFEILITTFRAGRMFSKLTVICEHRNWQLYKLC